ncbi:hypothetical protein ABZ742_04005 [Streptomyces albogriseolus]|uniref:hypothetical protein n=1 Tax=Streptomyces albogriseolus TaxID=1887 RepID=UPI00345FFDAD
MTQPLSQRVQDAVRDALATTTRNPDASLDTTAAFIASAVLAEVHRQPAAAAVAPPTNQTALRDRIRLAIARQWLDEMGSDRTVDELDNAEFGEFADAVLAVLPPTDRTAVLREADWIVEHCPDHGCVEPSTEVCHCEIADRLRRMADETATETPSMRLARQSVQAMTDTLQRACPPGCVACATDESHDPEPAAGARQDGAES